MVRTSDEKIREKPPFDASTNYEFTLPRITKTGNENRGKVPTGALRGSQVYDQNPFV